MRALAIAALLAAAAGAEAAPRVAIWGVRNDPDGTVGASLARAVCGRLECVDTRLVQAGKRIDFAIARRNGVDAVLLGSVVPRGSSRTLALALLRDSWTPVKTWSLPVDGQGRVDGAPVPEDVAALVEAAPAPAPAEATAVERAPAASDPDPEVRPAPPTPARAADPGEPPKPAAARGGIAAVELGAGAMQRRLAYRGIAPSAGTLRDFRGGTLVVPAARAEVFPFATGAFLGGLGAFAGYARSVGFRTEGVGTGKTYASVYAALDAGLAYRLPPLGRSGIRLVPAAWYRTVSFDVKPEGGTALAGLPDIALAGVAAGLGAEVPVSRRLSLVADASFTRWTTAKDLVGAGYFARGSAKALDLDAGAALDLTSRLSLRLLGTFAQTWFSLSGSSTYVASGATDRYVGVRGALRLRI